MSDLLSHPTSIYTTEGLIFKKPHWEKFITMLDASVLQTAPQPGKYDQFVTSILECSRASIPKGCWTNYIAGLTPETHTQSLDYISHIEENSFTAVAGRNLILTLLGTWILDRYYNRV